MERKGMESLVLGIKEQMLIRYFLVNSNLTKK